MSSSPTSPSADSFEEHNNDEVVVEGASTQGLIRMAMNAFKESSSTLYQELDPTSFSRDSDRLPYRWEITSGGLVIPSWTIITEEGGARMTRNPREDELTTKYAIKILGDSIRPAFGALSPEMAANWGNIMSEVLNELADTYANLSLEKSSGKEVDEVDAAGAPADVNVTSRQRLPGSAEKDPWEKMREQFTQAMDRFQDRTGQLLFGQPGLTVPSRGLLSLANSSTGGPKLPLNVPTA
ncbi:hypothetical protein M231_02619 [Tremella mesenterica]|uniref:Uncharacterized protein n=1 Tax=Tremella mesenterica TaxID=5217 RepID=A0A4Q1BQF7_TREME|nr:uncharacterized protein TREMEDRAFT_61239 [Tremella mesenterica DSM 1558]EIW70728.1 hypothetical protein TREMEDRAFT_61239 [Tremella mesenterica DSM 1558]RXK40161.1 hypothetical protein M231_02619 [Tremella mesenterica]